MADDPNLIALTVDIVAAFVGQNNIRPEDIPGFIASTHSAITALNAPEGSGAGETAQPEFTPAVSVRKSLASKDHILSMIDGKPYKTLRRHLSTHGLTPEDYRARYRLPANYPMVSESYSQTRREMAKKIGLGRKVGAKAAPAAAPAAPAASGSASASVAAPKKAPAAKPAAKSAAKPAAKAKAAPAKPAAKAASGDKPAGAKAAPAKATDKAAKPAAARKPAAAKAAAKPAPEKN